jgi:hypothetical protein
MTANATNVVIISDRVAPADQLGSVVYWSMSGPENHQNLCERVADLVHEDDLPSETTPSRALHRATQEVNDKQIFCRSTGTDRYIIGHQSCLAGSTGRLRELGTVAVVKITDDDKTVRTELRIECTSPVNELQTVFAKTRERIERAYKQELSILRPADIGAWMVERAVSFGAVALRPTGGFYFIPRVKRAAWANLTAAIGAPHKFYELPALTTTEAVHAITDALASEIEAATQSIRDELSDVSKPIGKRALDNRAMTCKELLDKVHSYETLLETKMDKLCENINYLEVAIATAKVTTMGGV